MPRAVVLLLLLTLSILGASKKPAKKESASSIVKALVRMEQEWSQAAVAKDAKTMDRIIADDWVSVDFQGNSTNKTQAIAKLKSGQPAAQAIELGDMKVRVLGSTAIVTGKDSSGKFAWMDVFMKREGHWQAVASQSTRIEK